MTRPDEDYLVREEDQVTGIDDMEAPAEDALEQTLPAVPGALSPVPPLLVGKTDESVFAVLAVVAAVA